MWDQLDGILENEFDLSFSGDLLIGNVMINFR
jgi:hypothetical protein